MENLKLIQTHFPDWKVFLYLGADIPAHFVSKVLQYPQVVLRYTQRTGHIVSLYRFLPLDEEGVECMIVRDADSRVHGRDRWAIHAFLESSYGVHAIRDHPWHTTEILAGLWGVKKGAITSIGDLLQPYIGRSGKFGIDQDFLREVVYPRVKTNLLVHTSQTFRYSEEEVQASFPTAWTDAQYCGKVENIGTRFSFFRR